MATKRKPTLAVWKFASCDGCQLSLLDCEDELLDVAGLVEIANFAELSRAVARGPYDISLVEGSITTPHDAERIHRIRRSSKLLVTIGACATAGGIQALRNFGNIRDYTAIVYASPQYIEALSKSTPIADHVFVDFELRGCPIDKHQLLEVLGALVQGRRPGLLRLFRAEGDAQHVGAGESLVGWRHETPRRRPGVPRIQRVGRAVQAGERAP
jgi:sulfhydrogenase subunit delta